MEGYNDGSAGWRESWKDHKKRKGETKREEEEIKGEREKLIMCKGENVHFTWREKRERKRGKKYLDFFPSFDVHNSHN